MRKDEFIAILRTKLSGLPKREVEERLAFYGEMIDDRIEEGILEEDAVNAVGNVDEVAAQIISDIPLVKCIKQKLTPKNKPGGWTIALLILGFPVWFPLLISAFAVVFSSYVSLWAVVVSLWAVFVSLAATAVGGVLGGFVLLCCGYLATGLALIGAALVCAGLGALSFYACKATTKACAVCTKNTALFIKKLCIRKENAQ